MPRLQWRDADRAVTALYAMHYRSLVRLAAMLVRDTDVADRLVQDSFVAMHSAWPRLANGDHALAYLWHSVLMRSRSALRRETAAGKPAPGTSGDGQDVTVQLEPSDLVSALRALPARQREALLLRFYSDMPQGQIASVMGISEGAVESHIARAMSSLGAGRAGHVNDPPALRRPRRG